MNPSGFKTNQQQSSKTKFDIISFLTLNFLSLLVFTEEKQGGAGQRIRVCREGGCVCIAVGAQKKRKETKFYQ